MTKQEAMKAIIETTTPEVGQIFILEDTTPARVVTWVKNRLTKSVYESVIPATTRSIYLFKVTNVNQYKYKDEDYNCVRTYTKRIDGELRCMDN